MANNGMSEDVEKTARTAKRKAEAAADEATDTAVDMARLAYQRADKARKNAMRQLYEGADELRHKARTASGEAREDLNHMARELERTAAHLNSQSQAEVAGAVATVQDNLWQSILSVFFVGLVAGWWLGNR